MNGLSIRNANFDFGLGVDEFRFEVDFSVSGASFNTDIEMGVARAPEVYEGAYIVEPMFREQVLETKHKQMEDDVTVNPIRVSRTPNEYGTTVYIGSYEE